MAQLVGIVGAGQGGTALLKTLLTVKNVNILGIVDRDLNSPGCKLAKAHGVCITDDFRNLLKKPGRKILIDATGVAKVAEQLATCQDDLTTFVSSEVALLLMQVVDGREQINKQLVAESTKLAASISDAMDQVEDMNDENGAMIISTVSKVNALTKSSQDSQKLLQETGKILQMIRHIADQTKMLGLNAAIEAARAGEYGRGFSVVAESIRQLAENSIQSASQVSGTLQQIHNAIAQIAEQIHQVVEEMQSLEGNQGRFTEEVHKSFRIMQSIAAELEKLSDAEKRITG